VAEGRSTVRSSTSSNGVAKNEIGKLCRKKKEPKRTEGRKKRFPRGTGVDQRVTRRCSPSIEKKQ